MNKIEISINKLNGINQWISNVDTKSSIIFTFFGVIITIVFTSNIGNSIANILSYKVADEINIITFSNSILYWLVITLFIVIVLSIYNFFQTLKGRINPNIYKQEGLNVNSNIFFGTIANKEYSKFEEEVNNETDTDILNDIHSQIYINSHIANRKFKFYNKSLLWTFIVFGIILLITIIK